jgi:hypothetical protein
MRSWSFCIKNSALILSLAIDNQHIACPCRETTTGASGDMYLFRVSPTT